MKKKLIFGIASMLMMTATFWSTPVQAQGGPCGPAIFDGSCYVSECGDCLYVDCGQQGSYVRCFAGEQ